MVVDNPVSFKKVEQIRLTILQTMPKKFELMNKKTQTNIRQKTNPMHHTFQSGWIQWIKECIKIGIKDHEKICWNAKKNMNI